MKNLMYLFTVCFSTTFGNAQTDTFFKIYSDKSANSMDLTSDGGYILAGGPNLLKTDNLGDSLWSRFYSNIYGYHFHSVSQTYDGGYILAGQVDEPDTMSELLSSVYVFKTDSFGDTTWTYTWNPASGDRAYSVQETRDSNFIVAGVLDNAINFGIETSFLLKLNQDGDTIWSKTFEHYTTAKSVIQTADDGYIFCGLIGINNFTEVYLTKTNYLGDTIWTKNGGLGFLYGRGEDVVQLADSSYIITGSAYHGSDQNIFVSKVDKNGNLIWSKEYGGSHDEYAQVVDVVNNEEFIVAGNTYSYSTGQFTNLDVWVLKLDKNGDTLWTKTYGNEKNNSVTDIKISTDGGFVICGNLPNSHESFLLKTDSLGNAPAILSNNQIPDYSDFEIDIYPNPTNEYLTIKCSPKNEYSQWAIIIYDSWGRKVHEFQDVFNNNTIQYNLASLIAGVYNVSVIIDDKYSVSRQFVKF